MRNKETKIVILGSYNSGKTTTLENLCQKKTKVDYKGSTIALDYGNTHLDGEKVHLFSTPGQERFRFMREILSRGLDGAIVVVDNSHGATSLDLEIMGTLEEGDIPYVVFSNKQDLNRDRLVLDSLDPVIIPTIAEEGQGLLEGLTMLLEIVKGC
jgi:small GTP-binding protein